MGEVLTFFFVVAVIGGLFVIFDFALKLLFR